MGIERVSVIVNPVAGACKQGQALSRLIRRMRELGMMVTVRRTAGPGDATRLAAEAVGPVQALIVAGGDGTVCEAANGLIGSDLPLLVWPTGTENLVAKSLGFKADAESTIMVLRGGRVLPLDVGVANGKSFLVVAGVGFDAEVVRRLVNARIGHITHLSWAMPLWRTFWEHRFPPVRVFTEDRLYWEGRGLVFLGNMSRYALGLPVVRDARPDDGLLDLCIYACRGRRQLIAHSVRTLFKRHVEHPDVRYARVRRVRVESVGPVPIERDGEFAGELPLEVSVRPAAIRVLVPPSQGESEGPSS
ncbi:MAG: diacylglycerol kinase family lipid kinase [Phycisphaerae bacterium]|jgi:YegS/Rv2252/BmrU family lipid kinase